MQLEYDVLMAPVGSSFLAGAVLFLHSVVQFLYICILLGVKTCDKMADKEQKKFKSEKKLFFDVGNIMCFLHMIWRVFKDINCR